MIITGCITMLAAAAISFFFPSTLPIFPNPKCTVTLSHLTCLTLGIILFFLPQLKHLQALIFITESFIAVSTGYEQLGLILFLAFIATLFFNHDLKTNKKIKFPIITILWILIILSNIPYGLPRVLMLFITSIFSLAIFLFFYNETKNHSKVLIPVKSAKNINFPKPGEKLFLSNYDLSERQKSLILLIIEQSYTYKELAELIHFSESTVKAEMQKIFKTFETPNLTSLHLFLSQYIVE